jgi:iron complex outermembrane recepter protein
LRHPSSAKIAILLVGVLRGLSICLLLVLCQPPAALAEGNAPQALTADIPAQPLARALETFARQTGLHLVYVSGLVRNQKSRAVAAGLSADEALARLLQGTGLKFEFLTAHSVRILAAVSPAAQSLPAPEESQPSLPVVLVTGSRIPVPASITATSPLQVVTADDILRSGHTDTVDVIGELPQMITSAGADGGNYSNGWGVTTVDLRGLGPQRTIVLINGRRLGLGDPNTSNAYPAPDLDQIPLQMVDRVEVLTGGASATYGSDAVAGAVNFILKDHVQGVQLDGQYGFAEHTQQNSYIQSVEAASGTTPPVGTIVDGFKRDISVLAGTGFHDEAGQVTGYFTYHSQNAIYGSKRDFADCAATNANNWTRVPTQTGVVCNGSTNSNQFIPNAGQGPAVYSVVGNQFVSWPAAGSVPPPWFNYAPYTSSQRQNTRYQAGLLAHIELNPAATPYLEFNFMEDRTLYPQAPSGLSQFDNPLTPDGNFLVNCSNPLLSAEEAAILCTPEQIAADKAHPGSVSADVSIGRRNIEGRGRLASFEHRNYRAVIGVRGKLGDGWSYDAYALYYYTSLSNPNENYLNLAAVNNALQVTTDQSARPVCISGGSCVPYDIFTSGAVTARQLAYLTITGNDGGANSEQILDANITGQLGRYGLVAPWAHDGIAFNAGAEHRVETLRFGADDAELAGDLSGFGGGFFGGNFGVLSPGVVAIDKRVSVDDGFLELRVPVAQDQPLTKDLTVDAGYRYSVYSTAGATNTYKTELQFAPISDMRLRASFEHVVRAPNLIELYTPLTYGLSLTVPIDPCAPTNGGATHAASSLSQCTRMGVTAAQYGNGIGPAFGGTNTIAQCVVVCGGVSGGNPGLAPESADTWSAGLTFTPRAIPTLTASVDYFHILLKGEIGMIPGAVTLNQCLATGDPTWCGQIVRTPAGALSGATVAGGGYIVQRDVNTGAALVSGIDIQVNHRRLFGGWGALSASLTGTWLQHNASTPYRSAPSYDCAGLFGSTCLNGSVNPKWRHNLRVTWETPWNVQLSAQWRFIDRTGFDNNSSQTLLQYQEEGFFDPVLTHIPSYSYLDLSAIWAVTPHVQIRAGVNNVLDKDPPFIPNNEISGATSGTLNTFPTYDVVGRNIFVAVRAMF